MLQIIKEHLNFKKQIFRLAKADIIKTYKGAALGWLWAIIKPVTTIFVYWFAFSVGIRAARDVAGHPFFIWLVVGIIPWFYMSEMLTQGTDSIRRYSYLVTKMNFPVSTVPTFVSISKLLIHMLLTIITIILLLVQGYSINIYYLQLPFYMVMMFAFFTAWALFAAPLAAISKDFSNLIRSLITAIFWLSGILWNPHSIKVKWLRKLLMLNPVTYISQGYRETLLYKRWFFESIRPTVGFLLVLIIMISVAIATYQKLRKEIPDVL